MLIKEIISTSDDISESSIQSRVYRFVLNNKKFCLKHYVRYENWEGHVLSVLDHPNIVKCYEHGIYEGYQYIILGFIEGELLTKKNFLSSNQVGQLNNILQYLKNKGVVHHDIKPANLIVNGDNVFLIDFGCAENIGDGKWKLKHPLGDKVNEHYGVDDDLAVQKIVEQFYKGDVK